MNPGPLELARGALSTRPTPGGPKPGTFLLPSVREARRASAT